MKKFFCGMMLAGMLLVTALPVRAQEKAEGEKGEKKVEKVATWQDQVFPWVNFILLAGGMFYLLKKPARDFFESRKKEIAEGLERGRKAEEDANLRMREIEQRLSSMSSDLATLRTQAEGESARERDNINAEAKKDMERVLEQSRQEIERIARGIQQDIKEQIAAAVVDQAGQSLQTQMTQDDQNRVVVRFLKKA